MTTTMTTNTNNNKNTTTTTKNTETKFIWFLFMYLDFNDLTTSKFIYFISLAGSLVENLFFSFFLFSNTQISFSIIANVFAVLD